MIKTDDTLPTTTEQAIDAGWFRLGKGASRHVFIHDDYPGRVLKIDDEWRRDRIDSSAIKGCKAEAEVFAAVEGTAFALYLTPVVAVSPCGHALLAVREWHTWSWQEAEEIHYAKPMREAIDSLGLGDLHEENVAGIVDDYGNLVAARALDYAFESRAAIKSTPYT